MKLAAKGLAFIFDLEGVLIDHLRRQCEVATKALASVGINVNIAPQMYQLRSEREFHITRDLISGLYIMQAKEISFEKAKENPQIVDNLRKTLAQSDWAKIDEAVKRFDLLRTHGKLELTGQKPIVILAKEPKLKKIGQMLFLAGQKGHALVLVTAGKKVDADAFMREAGILKYFKEGHIFYGKDKVTKAGLFAEASKIIVEKYGIRKGRQWVIEDSLSGIKDAKINKLRSALVLTGNTGMERIQRLPLN